MGASRAARTMTSSAASISSRPRGAPGPGVGTWRSGSPELARILSPPSSDAPVCTAPSTWICITMVIAPHPLSRVPLEQRGRLLGREPLHLGEQLGGVAVAEIEPLGGHGSRHG